jgi:hypothetical protein
METVIPYDQRPAYLAAALSILDPGKRSDPAAIREAIHKIHAMIHDDSLFRYTEKTRKAGGLAV